MYKIKCSYCNGNYLIRNGKYGYFAGCSNYPNCKSTINIYDLVFNYIKENGLNLYKWKRVCWNCKKEIDVFSYFLNYDLSLCYELFDHIGNIGLGDIVSVDQFLSQTYPTIKLKFSRTTNCSYIANICQYCNSLQGKNFIVDDPHEILNDLMFNKGMDNHLFCNLPYSKLNISQNEIKELMEPYFSE